MQALRAASGGAAMLCAGAYLLWVTTAISDYLRWVLAIGPANWGEFLAAFILPAIPLGLALMLLAFRLHAMTTIVATLGTAYYLVAWFLSAL